jgi:hypothetical protein
VCLSRWAGPWLPPRAVAPLQCRGQASPWVPRRSRQTAQRRRRVSDSGVRAACLLQDALGAQPRTSCTLAHLRAVHRRLLQRDLRPRQQVMHALFCVRIYGRHFCGLWSAGNARGSSEGRGEGTRGAVPWNKATRNCRIKNRTDK